MINREVTTSENHAIKGGSECPICGSGNIEAGRFEADGNVAWQPVYCADCGASWNDVYKLVGYSELEQASSVE